VTLLKYNILTRSYYFNNFGLQFLHVCYNEKNNEVTIVTHCGT